MGDLLGSWVPREWIDQVIAEMRRNPQHTFQVLTKNPARLAEFDWPRNAWLGTSIDGKGDSIKRLRVIQDIDVNGNIRFVSFEPLLADVVAQHGFDISDLDWVIVGAQTGPNALRPQNDWITDIGLEARSLGIPVFLKNNLPFPNYAIPGYKRAQEFPRASTMREDESDG